MMAGEAIGILWDYGVLVAPGLVLFVLLFLIVPPAARGFRIAVLILAFVFMRDVMTPAGIWRPGAGLTLAFISNGLVLTTLGLFSLFLVFVVARLPGLGQLIVWWRNGRVEGVGVGIGAGIAVAIPFLLVAGWDGFALSMPFWLAGMFVLAFGGNAFEEALFRGLLQGHLEERTGRLRAAVASGLAFGAGHAFLAYSVTDAGWPILAFTLAEGLACGLVRMRYGTVPAILTHGTAIVLVATPMLT